MQRSSIIAVLIALVIAGVSAYLFFGKTDADSSKSAQSPTDQPSGAKGLPNSTGGAGAGNNGLPRVPIRAKSIGEPPATQAPAVAPSPSTTPTSFPLKADQQVFLAPNAPSPKRQPLAPAGDRNNSPKYFYELTLEKFSIVDEETSLATLSLFDSEGVAQKLATTRGRVLRSDENPQLGGVAIEFVDAGDTYTATLSGAELGLAPGMYIIATDVDIGDQMALAKAPFFYTPGSDVPGYFTGRVQHETVDEGLLASVELSVIEAGEFIIDANLMGASDEPIARATFRGEVPEGFHSVQLAFANQYLQEKQNEGPFVLRNLRGYKVRKDQKPNRVMMSDSPPITLE